MRDTLWTRNFTLITCATGLGAVGGIASSFALSFLVFDETGSTLASALLIAMQFLPSSLLPLAVSPWMDRLPRKPFLVVGDAVNGLCYLLAGQNLRHKPFSYVGYLAFSLLLACLTSMDELAYKSLYPKLLTEGKEEKGYTISSMLYPVLKVVMMPVSALLFETMGVSNILLMQAGLSLSAALLESRIRVHEERRGEGTRFSPRVWLSDLREAARYLKGEPGLLNLFVYMGMTNGVAAGYGPLLVAFFRTMPGMTTAMYSLFSVAEFAGRTLGGLVRYRSIMQPKRRFAFLFGVYQAYELMDISLLWLPYPLMLLNRAACGFLGINSAAIRQAAVQRYLPDRLRARVSALESVLFAAAVAVLSLAVGALGEIMDLRVCLSLCAAATLLVCWLTVFRSREHIRRVLAYKAQE